MRSLQRKLQLDQQIHLQCVYIYLCVCVKDTHIIYVYIHVRFAALFTSPTFRRHLRSWPPQHQNSWCWWNLMDAPTQNNRVSGYWSVPKYHPAHRKFPIHSNCQRPWPFWASSPWSSRRASRLPDVYCRGGGPNPSIDHDLQILQIL
jgi:hypothetical protein